MPKRFLIRPRLPGQGGAGLTPPPLESAPFGTWRGIYVAVAALLVAEIVVFYWLSRHFG